MSRQMERNEQTTGENTDMKNTAEKGDEQPE